MNNENKNKNNQQQEVKKEENKQENQKEVNVDKATDKNLNNKKDKDANLKLEIKKLEAEIEKYKKTLGEKETIIFELNKKITDFNNNYVNEMTKKANEAQEKVQLKIKEYQEKFDNELAHIKKYALKDKIVELIDIINNFEVVVNAPVKDPAVANYVQGFKMFSNMFTNYLNANNVFAIEPKLNEEYNPKTMEAFDTEQKEGFKPNTIIKVIKKGYRLHDIVIVPATVIVAK